MSTASIRLRVEKAGGGWCPKLQIEKGVREFIEINLGVVHVVTGVQTQGRYDRGRGQEYVEEYLLEYWRPGLLEWREYKRWDGKRSLFGLMSRNNRLLENILKQQIAQLVISDRRRRKAFELRCDVQRMGA
ncbi:hypothetical protein HUJ04_008314 [Dendroctonus ponderosae]|nr:hypothetical protein HUJ04_008314 [Dendroctonus ponderosae]